jgi:hypothetical protein
MRHDIERRIENIQGGAVDGCGTSNHVPVELFAEGGSGGLDERKGESEMDEEFSSMLLASSKMLKVAVPNVSRRMAKKL